MSTPGEVPEVQQPATPMPDLSMYSTFRMQRLGSIAVIQPFNSRGDEVAGPSFTCDLETGTVGINELPKIESNYQTIYGVLGLVKFDSGPALVIATASESVATMRGSLLLKITATQVLADEGSSKWTDRDRQLLHLLRGGIDPKRFGGGLYYNFKGDATLNNQRYITEGSKTDFRITPGWRAAEPAFFWNQNLAKPLFDIPGAFKFIPVAFMGFAAQLGPFATSTTSTDEAGKITVTLIARRSARRPGCRQWRRGADTDANVANFVESEQIIELLPSPTTVTTATTATKEPFTASFVQVRGSIPILWSQAPNLKYKIPIKLADPSTSAPVFAKHAQQLESFYGNVTAINLANQTGREGKLSATYKDTVDIAKAVTNGFRLVPFDFHKHCGATNYQNLEMLWADIVSNFESNGYWVGKPGHSTAARQNGVFRTNCVDTLDRTNVVQGMLARKQLESVLRKEGVMSESDTLVTRFPELEAEYRVLWADHGDEISRQYAGTGAMKSAFTRTGKRDVAGLLDDGTKSLTRYFLNNFNDGHKQDALDLVTGSYKIGYGKLAPLKQSNSPLLPVLLILACIVMAVMNMKQLAVAGQLLDPLALIYQVLAFLGIAVAGTVFLFKNGRKFVDTPQLLPDAATPWLKN